MTFIKDYLKNNPNTIIVDSGDLGYTKDQVAFILDALKKMGYAAIGVGDADARIGDDFYTAAKERGVQVLEAGPNQPAGVKPFIIQKINGLRVGVISFGSLGAKSLADAKPLDVRKARYAAFMEARKASDILILLDQAGVADEDWLTRNAKRLGSPDLVIGTAGRGASVSQSRTIGGTTIAPVGTQARSIGVVKVYRSQGKAGFEVEINPVELGENYADDKDMADAVQKFEQGGQKYPVPEPAAPSESVPETPSPQVPPPPPTPSEG